MHLPCPHCRRQFKVRREQFPSARAKIKCPACEGVFVLNLVPSSRPGELGASPTDSRWSLPPQSSGGGGNDSEGLRESDVPASASADAWTSPGMESATVRHALDRDRPRFLLFWTLVPACCLFLALTGILLSGPRQYDSPLHSSVSRTDTGMKSPLSSSVSSHPEGSRHREGQHRTQEAQTPPSSRLSENLIARAFWTLTSDPKAPCDTLLRSQAGLCKSEAQDACRIYPLWIAYLILETDPAPACELEPTFSLAANALQRKTLCGAGHAFLCAYYLKKGLLDRSQSFLEQALRQAPDDPCVKLVEAVFYEQAYHDDRRAISILAGLNGQHPSFSLVGYTLGKAYVRKEEYREANAAFESLEEETKGLIAFGRIRHALSSLEQTADQGEKKAEAILALSRAFTALKDYPMAQDLYLWVLEEMPDMLPRGDRMAACCELGGIYKKRGDKSSAYDSYRNALGIDPEFQAAREGIKGLFSDQANQS